MSADARLARFVTGPRTASKPAAHYQNATSWGNLLFLSGKSAAPADGKASRGKLGREFTVEEGKHFAHLAAIELLLVIKDELGSLDRVAQVVELQGFVNATEDFEDHALVLDGASDTFVEVLGDVGIHARSVLGASSLRGGNPVILRAVVGVRP
ncbi:RidA family protein [Cupriavidus basilensis]